MPVPSVRMTVKELEKIAAEFDADVKVNDDGETEYRFPSLREAFVATELARKGLKLDSKKIGKIVYDSSDTEAEGTKRDLDEFDRQLQAAELDLSKYLPATNETGYEEDFEVLLEKYGSG